MKHWLHSGEERKREATMEKRGARLEALKEIKEQDRYTVITRWDNGRENRVEITAEEIHLSVGAVNEPSPLSIKG